MALLNQAVQNYGQLGSLFEKLREGQAPEKFNREFLKDLGFTSSNHHAFIPLLKGLGFLSDDGVPTATYKEFLDGTKWRKILAQAVRDAYGDIFVLKAKPDKSDRKMVAGKFKTAYNLSETVADRAAGTFLALLELSDPQVLYASADLGKPESKPSAQSEVPEKQAPPIATAAAPTGMGLHYNIQIHLPATKDVEVYNAIFKSLRMHLVD